MSALPLLCNHAPGVAAALALTGTLLAAPQQWNALVAESLAPAPQFGVPKVNLHYMFGPYMFRMEPKNDHPVWWLAIFFGGYQQRDLEGARVCAFGIKLRPCPFSKGWTNPQVAPTHAPRQSPSGPVSKSITVPGNMSLILSKGRFPTLLMLSWE